MSSYTKDSSIKLGDTLKCGQSGLYPFLTSPQHVSLDSRRQITETGLTHNCVYIDKDVFGAPKIQEPSNLYIERYFQT
jgi:hypothetical protein